MNVDNVRPVPELMGLPIPLIQKGPLELLVTTFHEPILWQCLSEMQINCSLRTFKGSTCFPLQGFYQHHVTADVFYKSGALVLLCLTKRMSAKFNMNNLQLTGMIFVWRSSKISGLRRAERSSLKMPHFCRNHRSQPGEVIFEHVTKTF